MYENVDEQFYSQVPIKLNGSLFQISAQTITLKQVNRDYDADYV